MSIQASHRARFSVPLLLSISLALRWSPASAQTAAPTSKPTGCQEVTQRILAPLREKVETAQRAVKEYEEDNQQNIKKIQDRIATLEGTAQEFAAERAVQEKKLRDRIRWCQEAIQEATGDARTKIAAARKEASDWRSKNREDRARGAEDNASRIEKALADGKYEWHKKELGMGSDINGWHRGVKDNTDLLAKVMADFAAGTYPIHVKKLGYGQNWKQIQENIGLARADLAKAGDGEFPYFLHTLGFGQNRKQVQGQVELCAKELAKVEASIVAGTYAVFVPALGYHADRNAVKQMIADAIERQWRAGAGLKDGVYKNPRSRAGDKTSGQLNQEFLDQLKALGIAERNNRGADISRIKAEIQRGNEAMRDLERLAGEEQASVRKELDGRLTDALNQTPCGGGSKPPRNVIREIVERERRDISKLSEKSEEGEQERRRRTNDYEDLVYIDEDGTVHGDLKLAWSRAMGVTKTQPADAPEGKSNAELIQDLKGLVDWLVSIKDFKGLGDAQRSITAFIDDVQKLDPANLDPQKLAQMQERIAQHIKNFEDMLASGVFSEARLKDYERALRAAGQPAAELETQLQKIYQLRRTAHSADRMFRSGGALRRALIGVARPTSQQVLTFVTGSTREATQRIKAWGAEMKNFDRGMLALGMIAAGAEAYQQIDEGVAPSEAVARSSVNFAIDLAVGGVPVLAAAEIACQATFSGYAYATGDKAVAEAVPSGVIKAVAREALDRVAAAATTTGEYEGELERIVWKEPNIGELLNNVDLQRIRESLARTEAQLAAQPPDGPQVARLIRMRATFRRVLRADAEYRVTTERSG